MTLNPRVAISDPEARRIVLRALEHGWAYRGLSGTTHHVIEHEATGTRLTFSSSPKVASWKTLATDIERISGKGCVWPKGSRKASKRKHTHTAFTDTRLAPGQMATRAHLDECAQEYRSIWWVMQNGKATRPMIDKLLHLEQQLRANYQPCPIPHYKWVSEYFDDPLPQGGKS